ncbi:MAG: class I SAM-dependent methyltransferase, partial [Melioribacteraceae bacterium]|nr:class I SAM-dependent methyltransferase [Melioribacteraceae bacterium]
MDRKDVDKFHAGFQENVEFWKRFEEIPDVKGKNVLDIGCGWGTLAIELAQPGAKRVVGVDIKCELIDFSNQMLSQNYQEFKDSVSFKCLNLKDFNCDILFDIVVSKDSFEHILNLPEMLEELNKRLSDDGKIYTGFGPLY